MHDKLTLRLERGLIKKAKTWAKSRRLSLSQAVAEFFSQLPGTEESPDLSPWTRRLAGVVSRKRKAQTDEKVRKDYLDYLEAKHR